VTQWRKNYGGIGGWHPREISAANKTPHRDARAHTKRHADDEYQRELETAETQWEGARNDGAEID